MHSRFRHGLISHNLRHAAPPDAQPDAPPTTAAPGPGKTPRAERWAELGRHAHAHTALLDASAVHSVMRGPAIVAHGFEPEHDLRLTAEWDVWMARKLRGEADPRQAAIAQRLVQARMGTAWAPHA